MVNRNALFSHALESGMGHRRDAAAAEQQPRVMTGIGRRNYMCAQLGRRHAAQRHAWPALAVGWSLAALQSTPAIAGA